MFSLHEGGNILTPSELNHRPKLWPTMSFNKFSSLLLTLNVRLLIDALNNQSQSNALIWCHAVLSEKTAYDTWNLWHHGRHHHFVGLRGLRFICPLESSIWRFGTAKQTLWTRTHKTGAKPLNHQPLVRNVLHHSVTALFETTLKPSLIIAKIMRRSKSSWGPKVPSWLSWL